MEVTPHRTTDTGYSDYGVSRGRHCSRHRCRRSRSRSSSSSRRRRSEWSLKKFKVSGKDVRKLNCYELIVASIRRCLNIDSVTVADLLVFLEHLKLLASRAKNDDF